LENQDDAIAISAQSVCVHRRAGGSRGVGREHCADAEIPAAANNRSAGVLDTLLVAEQNRKVFPVNATDQREQPKAYLRWLLNQLFF
jgi:hypothetical protein